MKRVLFTILIGSIGLSVFAQAKQELEVGFSNSLFLKNTLVGTSETYESQLPFSSINLKCSNIASLKFNYINGIGKSNWFLTAGYDRVWIKYNGVIFRQIYNPGIPENGKESIELINLLNVIKFGGGYTFSFFSKKLEIKPYTFIAYRIYRDQIVDTRKNLNFSNLDVGDFGYQVFISNKDYSKMFVADVGIKTYFNIIGNLKAYIDLSYTIPYQTVYTSFQNEVTSKTYNPASGVLTTWLIGQTKGPFRIKTTNLNLGVGLNIALN